MSDLVKIADKIAPNFSAEVEFSLLEELLSLDEIKPGFFKKQAEFFCSYSIELFVDLSAAVNSDQRSDVVKKAHSLKGSAANFGARALANACSKLEESAATLSLSELQAQLVTIEYGLNAFNSYLKQLMAEF